MSNTEFLMVPNELAERAIDAFASIGMHDELLQLHEILDKPAEQHHGEPVCEVVDMKYNRVQFYRATGDTSKPYLSAGTKLYTHADPGEIERWKSAAESMSQVVDMAEQEIKSLREDLRLVTLARDVFDAQVTRWQGIAETEAESRLKDQAKLAERDALLREVIDGKTRTQFDGNLMHRILMVLSSSAEPSAPVERDERAAVRRFKYVSIMNEGCALVPQDDGPDPDFDTGSEYVEAVHYDEARAALERKP